MLRKLSSFLKEDQNNSRNKRQKSKKEKLSEALRENLFKRKEFQKRIRNKRHKT